MLVLLCGRDGFVGEDSEDVEDVGSCCLLRAMGVGGSTVGELTRSLVMRLITLGRPVVAGACWVWTCRLPRKVALGSCWDEDAGRALGSFVFVFELGVAAKGRKDGSSSSSSSSLSPSPSSSDA